MKRDKQERSKPPGEGDEYLVILYRARMEDCVSVGSSSPGSLGRATLPAVARLAHTSSAQLDTLYLRYLL